MPNERAPVDSFRYGAVSAAIWRNETDKGAFYNVTFARTYRQGDDLKNASSFGFNDLHAIERLAGWAFDTIHELRKDDREAAAAHEDVDASE